MPGGLIALEKVGGEVEDYRNGTGSEATQVTLRARGELSNGAKEVKKNGKKSEWRSQLWRALWSRRSNSVCAQKGSDSLSKKEGHTTEPFEAAAGNDGGSVIDCQREETHAVSWISGRDKMKKARRGLERHAAVA